MENTSRQPRSKSTGCKAAIYGTGGAEELTRWSSSYGNTATKMWTAPSSGTYYLRVAPNYGSSFTGDYEVSVTLELP